MRGMNRAQLLVALLFSVASCGGDSGPATVSAEEFPSRFAAGWCGLVARCCEASGGTPQATCETDTHTAMSLIGQQAAQDGATFDGEAADRCLVDLQGATC